MKLYLLAEKLDQTNVGIQKEKHLSKGKSIENSEQIMFE